MFVALLSIIFIMIDQFSKFLVVKYLYDGLNLTIIDNFMWFIYTENTGAAFGILKDARIFFHNNYYSKFNFNFYFFNKILRYNVNTC